MYKAVVFFDLDQTLLNDDKQVPPENVAALKALEANQILPVIATGRNYYELADIMAATGSAVQLLLMVVTFFLTAITFFKV